MNATELNATLVRMAYVAGCGRQPTPDEWTAARNAIAADGSNLDNVISGILAGPEATAHLALIASIAALVKANAQNNAAVLKAASL